MAVSLPSDLVLDVMRNADPARVSTATARLQSIGGDGASATDFAKLLDDVTSPSSGGHGSISDAGFFAAARTASAGPGHAGSTQEAYVEFERMVLRNLMESLLPDAGSGVFGSGPSAGVWRSLAADQLAGLYAGSGGIGIAASLSSSGESKSGGREWPYFSSGEIEAFAG